ncbi:hypothetical protein F5Y05DRAFT_339932 [Hypoxylon sp. FL0543]|nr:hypothetical protein F5Y05DRAFT_339932 [Hypoxylon sp. FL0543]
MSLRLKSESIRKRVKAMKAMISITELEHPNKRIRQWKSNETLRNSHSINEGKNSANVKTTDTKCPDGLTNGQLNGQLDGTSNGYTNGHANGHANGYLSSPVSGDKPSHQHYRHTINVVRSYEVVARKHNTGGDTAESPMSISSKEEDSPIDTPKNLAVSEGNETNHAQNGEIFSPTAPSAKTENTFVDSRTTFRAWSDKELKFQCQVINKYDFGGKLWTKEALIALEDKIEGNNSVVKIPAFVGEEYVFEKEQGVTYKVEFHGYQALAFPPSYRPDGVPYCSMTLKAKPFDYSETRSREVELAMFDRCRAIWCANPLGQHFYSLFMKLPLPPYINKIVCFDLGSVTAKPADNYPHIRQAMYRHAAVLTLVECLFKRFGCMIRLFAQDTTYTNACMDVLFKKGFSIVGKHGAGGFVEIDDRTLVFAPNPGFCVKEIVADVAQPAAMFWGTVLSPEESERATRSARPVEFDDRLSSYYFEHQADPDTSRVRALSANYARHSFPITNLFGPVSLYTRSGFGGYHLRGG